MHAAYEYVRVLALVEAAKPVKVDWPQDELVQILYSVLRQRKMYSAQ